MPTLFRFYPLVFAALRRHRVRTLLTIASVMMAFLLFGLLMALSHAFYGGVKTANRRTLITMSSMSFIESLPRADAAEIASIPGVAKVAYEVWIGAYYQHQSQILFALAVSPKRWLAQRTRQLSLPTTERTAWLGDRRGALVGSSVARRYHWKIGEIIPIRSNIWVHPNGTNTWPVKLDGIFHSKSRTLEQVVILHYRYWNGGVNKPNVIGMLRIEVHHLSELTAVAHRIDTRFANSPYPTRTSSARTFMKNFIDQTVDIGLIVQDILIAVFFTMLLVTANTLARSVRERSSEIAILRTQGYSRRLIFALILAEALVVVLTGGILGTLLAALLVEGLHTFLAEFLPTLRLTTGAELKGLGLMILFACASALLPVYQIQRLKTADALRGG
ncbi:MAG: ABC transporter permease [Gammaproteobacteria bacterium]